MKKKIFLCAITVGVLFLTACGSSLSFEETNNKNTTTERGNSKDNEATADVDNAIGADGQYTWQELTITLPEDWENNYVIVDNERGFSIYQKASYEEREESGFICAYCRTTDFMDYGMGENLIAYTDSGMLYYLMQPLDVDCATNEEEMMREYSSMCEKVGEINASLQIAGSGVHFDAEEYVVPISSIYVLDEGMIEYLSGNDLWIAKNEIYARHGRQFNNEYLQQYFNRCSWYDGTIAAEQFEESTLSQLEKDNVKFLEAAKEEYDRQHPYPKKYIISETATEDLSGDGTANQIKYQVTEQENGAYQCVLTIDDETYILNEIVYMIYPIADAFYITDISEDDNLLEIAVLDDGPSNDPVTNFFQYDGTLTYIGQVSGFPFADQSNGINGFNGIGGVTGRVRIDLIETAYLSGYWRYDSESKLLVYQDMGWNEFLPTYGHTLYEDLIVHYEMNEASGTTIIPAQEEVYFLGSDSAEWILVRGKDGSKGYIQVVDGMVMELNKPADQVFSDLYFFD